jgi:hypothetical protein
MQNCLSNVNLRLFADDANMFLYATDLQILFNNSNMALENLKLWLSANKLSVNIDKCNYSLYSNRKIGPMVHNSYKLYLHGSEIERCTTVKYLGVQIDDQLTWNDHIDGIYKNILKYSRIFYKIRDKLPSRNLKDLYFASVYPLISYGIELYANTNQSNLHQLSILNNKILRTLQKESMTTSTNNLYINYKTLPIPLLHEFKLLLLVHKFTYDNLNMPVALRNYFSTNSNIHSHNTRQRMNYHLQISKTSFGLRCFDKKAAKLWNELPECIKNINSTKLFKSRLLSYMTEKTYHLINKHIFYY